jgi:hypothetical protein
VITLALATVTVLLALTLRVVEASVVSYAMWLALAATVATAAAGLLGSLYVSREERRARRSIEALELRDDAG